MSSLLINCNFLLGSILHLNNRAGCYDLNIHIADFRRICENNVKDADKIMGHAWLYRTDEVAIKAIVGLFAALRMVLGFLGGPGFLKKEHRQLYKDVFFALNQTDSIKGLQVFQRMLGGSETYTEDADFQIVGYDSLTFNL
jgi:hypothetical protein